MTTEYPAVWATSASRSGCRGSANVRVPSLGSDSWDSLPRFGPVLAVAPCPTSARAMLAESAVFADERESAECLTKHASPMLEYGRRVAVDARQVPLC